MSSNGSTRSRISVILALALIVLPGALAAQDGGGVILGKVFDPAGEVLAGAEIQLVGTNQTSVTSNEGSFLLSSVPAGKQTVTCTYMGLQELSVEVEVVAGETISQDFNLSFGGTVEISGSPLLIGQAKALNQQKTAVNITNVVASDQIGRFPDSNAAEATQRIPGINLLRDQGEGRYVMVRGTEARLNSTTVNGERLPSPEAGTRDIALDTIPADLLEAIEVSKALTPDMDGDAIGGTVNLVTARAPEKLRVSAGLGMGYREQVEEFGGNGNFTYGNRFSDNKFGLLVSGSLSSNDQGSQNFEPEYDDGELDEMQLRNYTLTRERFGLTADFDIRASDQANYYLRGLLTNYQDTEDRRAKVEVLGDGEIERALRSRSQESDIYSLRFGGENILGSAMVLDYHLMWNRAQEETPNQMVSTFIQEDVEFDPNVSPDSIDPDNIQSNPLNEDLAEFWFDEIETEHKKAEEEDIVGAINLSKGFYRDAGFGGHWKAGAKVRFKDKDQFYDVFAHEADDDLSLLDYLGTYTPATPFVGGRYDLGMFQDPGAMRDLLNTGTLESERNLEEDLADFTVSEDTLAAYGMVELLLGAKSTFLGGLRVEDTSTEYLAYELIVDEEGDPVDLLPVTGAKDYTEWLPMVHYVYRVNEDSNLRAAVTRTLARPNFEDMAPWRLMNQEDEEIELGNPDLNVTTSWNVDLLYERYLAPLGIFSAGVFYKDLTDNIYFFNFDEEIDGVEFEVTQPQNGAGATLWGLEFAFQNRFASLPSPWDGLGVYVNYTWSDSEADYPDRASTVLQGQAENVGNLALSYEKGGFSGRLSFNYNGKSIVEVGEEAAEDLWVDDHAQLDFMARYQISKKFSVVLEFVNLTDEPYRIYEGTSDRPRQEEYYGWWGILGFRFDL